MYDILNSYYDPEKQLNFFFFYRRLWEKLRDWSYLIKDPFH